MTTFNVVAAVPFPQHADAPAASEIAATFPFAADAPLPGPLSPDGSEAALHLRRDGAAAEQGAAALTSAEGSSPCRWANKQEDRHEGLTHAAPRVEQDSAPRLFYALRELRDAPAITVGDWPSPGDLVEAT